MRGHSVSLCPRGPNSQAQKPPSIRYMFSGISHGPRGRSFTSIDRTDGIISNQNAGCGLWGSMGCTHALAHSNAIASRWRCHTCRVAHARQSYETDGKRRTNTQRRQTQIREETRINTQRPIKKAWPRQIRNHCALSRTKHSTHVTTWHIGRPHQKGTCKSGCQSPPLHRPQTKESPERAQP